MLDKLLRKIELFCWRMTKNKGISIWDKFAIKIGDYRTYRRFKC